MDDLISRQAAIETVKRLSLGETDAVRLSMRIADYLNRMPPAQPEIIRCKDCKFLRLTGNVWKCQNRLVMMLCEPNDYCSRAERKEE